MQLRFVLLVLAVLLVCDASAVEPVVHRLTAETRSLALTDDAGLIDDSQGTLTASEADALTQSGAVRRVSNPKPPVMRSHRLNVSWLRLDFTVDASAPRDWLLAVQSPVHDRDRIYLRDDQGRWVPSQEAGATLPFSSRPFAHRDFVFPVRLTHAGATTILLRSEDSGASPIRATLWSPEALRASDKWIEGLYHLYYGLVGGMILYNILLFIVLGDRRFLLYTGFVASLATAVAGNTGLGAWIWGDWAWWTGRSFNVGYSSAILCSVTLTRHFLATRTRLPVADLCLRALAWAGACALFASLVLPNFVASMLIVPIVLPTALLTVGLSVIGVIRRWPSATYFCAAWMALPLGSLIATATSFGLLPWSLNTPDVVAMSSAWEMILLSLALADRINEERRQKERAQAHSMALLRASQALSSETRLDRLHARLCKVMADVTGASAVHFVMRDSDRKEWFVYAGSGSAERIPVQAAGQTAQAAMLPVMAFRHIEATGRALVVADAMRDERFASDPALQGAARCALLGLPVIHLGELTAVLLLESRTAEGGFPEISLGAVEAVAGPLAVSLQNVLLYERLEQRVAEQTQELRDTQAELLATARRAGRAEIATNVLHNVGNALNSVNVASELMRSQVASSRVSGLARAVDLLVAHKEDLGAFLESDPKGRLLPEYLQQLSAVLQQEKADLLQHLERLAASVDSIKNVVATQQSYAGPSVIAENVRPVELVEDALRIAGDGLGGGQVGLVREFDEVGPVRLDRSRALQILVNLLANAQQAMESVSARRLTLTLRVQSAGGKLSFQVQDTGCGILPENLVRIFSHGFTTREDGRGFGLHGCAIAAREMGGILKAHSEGPGQGATFTLELPLARA